MIKKFVAGFIGLLVSLAVRAETYLFDFMAKQGMILASFPNISDIAATTIESRSKVLADNVTKNNALLRWLDEGGNTKLVTGGTKIYQELSFAENGNAGYYSGYDLLPTAAQDVLSAAEFELKQAACPVVISGLEQLQNAGRERMIELLEGRMAVAESSMMNLLAGGVYSDGTGSGGKQVTGLDLAINDTPSVGTYGGIDPATWTFWQNKYTATALTSANVDAAMNTMWASLVRGMDRPNLLVMDAGFWGMYVSSLQSQQRFTSVTKAVRGFPTIGFMDADVVLDGGLGGFAPTNTCYFLNTKYLHWRPHAQRNMVPLNPNKRYATNQDAEVQIIAWAGNLTCSGRQFQGRLYDNG